jgi:hypothetical protein
VAYCCCDNCIEVEERGPVWITSFVTDKRRGLVFEKFEGVGPWEFCP